MSTQIDKKNNSDRDHKTHQKRRLKIPGVSNYRDLGGYQTLDGLTVKWGQLYRSGHLTNLTSRGLDIISDFDLYAIINFRSNFESARQPKRVLVGPKLIHLPIMDQANREMSKEIRERIQNKNYDGFIPDRLILKSYQQFPTDFNPAFRTFLHTVRDAGGKPVLWHCTAGKDRTGYAAAILLRLLGVDQSVIYQDYLLSNQYVNPINRQVLAAIIARGYKAYRMIRPMMSVQQKWLMASFESIEKEWGSFEAYVSDGLDLSSSDVEQMRNVLLE